MRRCVVERRQVLVRLAAGMQEALAVLHRDLLQRFQAIDREAGAHHLHAPDAARGQRRQRLVGVGLQPWLVADPRLERDRPLRRREAQARRDLARAALALAEIRVAGGEVAARNAMEREQQVRVVAAAAPRPDRLRHRVQPRRVGPVVLHEAQLRHEAPAGQFRRHGVEHRRGGGGRILRIQRQHQQAAQSQPLQLAQHRRDRRLAVAHGHAHRQGPRAGRVQLACDGGAQAPGEHHQGRALGGPDARVGLGRTPRTQAQDHPVQEQPPQQARLLHHPGIPQEFGQVAPHRGRGRRIRGAQVDQQHPGQVGPSMGEIGGAAVRGGHSGFRCLLRAPARGWGGGGALENRADGRSTTPAGRAGRV